MRTLLCALGMLVVSAVFLSIYFLIDRWLTQRRLRINQAEWDAFSAGMDESQKLEVFNDWCRESMIRQGWPHYYFPRM